MSGLCPFCSQPVEVVDFRLDAGHLLVRCTGCKREQRLSIGQATQGGAEAQPAPPREEARAAEAAAQKGLGAIEPPFTPPAGFCPKCISVRAAEAQSCPACGLHFSNSVLDGALLPSAALEAAWTELASHWGEAAEHTRFVRMASAAGELAAAGRLYRIRLAQAPKDALARTSLEAAIKLASAPVSVEALKTLPDAVAAKRRVVAAVGATAVLLGLLAVSLFRLLRRL